MNEILLSTANITAVQNVDPDKIFDDLAALRIFVKTIELGSFSEVARRLDVTPAMVSKRMALLEARVGHRLLNRNTRGLFSTDAGQRLYDRCVRVLTELDRAAAELSDLHDVATGHLRMTAPLLLGTTLIAPRLPDFLKRYPGLSVDLSLSIERLDIFQNRIDIAVRIAESIDPGMIAIRLAPYRRVFCASPEYLDTHGYPSVPDDLRRHNCLISRGATPNYLWPVIKDGEISRLAVQGSFSSDNGDAVRAAALAGLGITMASRLLVEEHLRSGALVELLPNYTPQTRSVYAVLVQRTDSSRKLSVMVEFLQQCFAEIK